jgi:Reverse transcriptase (RNA-dependent DNA polymerase)
VHFVFACKHDGCYKARLVADGHLTDTPIDSVYSSVASLRGVRIVMFLAELNDLNFWSTDIGNAFLESDTMEKIYILGGKEFECIGMQGHTLVIVKALYGLKSSGMRWWGVLADVLREMGFVPSKANRDIWMRPKQDPDNPAQDHYEYIMVYVDDLGIASKAPEGIVKELEERYGFNLKGFIQGGSSDKCQMSRPPMDRGLPSGATHAHSRGVSTISRSLAGGGLPASTQLSRERSSDPLWFQTWCRTWLALAPSPWYKPWG